MKVSLPIRLALAAVMVFVLIPVAACGAQEDPEHKNSWQDEGELAFVQTGGNTEIITLAAKNTLTYHFDSRWLGSWIVGVLYGKSDGDKVAERFYTDLRVDYACSERVYFYGLTGWEQDQFAGVDNRIYIGPGVGYHILTGERHFLSTEAGLSYAREDYTDNSDQDFLEGRLYSKYTFEFNPSTKFSQSLEYLHNFDDAGQYHITSISDLITSINDRISLKTSYEILYANEPIPATLDKTDTMFKVTLVVNI